MADQEWTNHSGLTAGVDFDMDRAGADLRIPQDERANPALEELVGFMVRVDELQQDLLNATLQAAQAPLPPFLDGTHPLTDRYHAAEQLLRVVHALLREGLAFWELRQESGGPNFDHLEEKLGNALGPYGLAVTPQDQ